ncbi:unnamed protein product, partial [Brassica napus]
IQEFCSQNGDEQRTGGEHQHVTTFCVPSPDKEIQHVEGLVSETRPRSYTFLTSQTKTELYRFFRYLICNIQ